MGGGGNDVVTNNYVYFNCSHINNQTASTCELYRIIGVFPTDDGTGNIENRIKLIKAENYGNNYWDYQSSSSGSNNWARPATLNIMLNETYWSTINSDYQNLIEDVKYYLGGNTTTIVNTNVMYQYERKIDETDGGNYYYVGNPISWIGKLALMYASDYGYAANSECSDSTTLSNYETNSCPDNNWLYFGKDEWLLPQYSPRNDYSFIIYPSGFVNTTAPTSSVINPYAVRPVFYLTVDAEFVGGTGTNDDPYRLL